MCPLASTVVVLFTILLSERVYGGCVTGRCGLFCSMTCPRDCAQCDTSCNCLRCDEGRILVNARLSLLGISIFKKLYCIPCPENCLTCKSHLSLGDKICPDECFDHFVDDYEEDMLPFSCEPCAYDACMTCAHGKSGHSCDEPCAPYCSSCWRYQPGVCTACQPNVYGYNAISNHYYCNLKCSEICENAFCNDKTGHCNGCVKGIWGPQCNITCPEHCLNHICGVNNGSCLNGCENDRYGTECELKCSNTCKLSEDGSGSCDSYNGTCLHGYQDGYYGSKCEERCSVDCLEVKSCDQFTGACQPRYPETDFWDGKTRWLIIAAGSLVIVLILIAVVIIVISRKRRRSMERSNGNQEIEHDDGCSGRPVTNTTERTENHQKADERNVHKPSNNDVESHVYYDDNADDEHIYSDIDQDNVAPSLYLDLSNYASGGAVLYIDDEAKCSNKWETYESLNKSAKDDRYYADLPNDPKKKRK
ncbi:hypothetical protein ACF0H5_007612 [Mactra antiquata]